MVLMSWRDAWPNFSELGTLDWSAPERWPKAVQVASWAVAGIASLALVWLFEDSSAELEMAKRELGVAKARHEGAARQKSEIDDMRRRLQALKLAIGEGSQQYLRPDELPDLLHLLAGLSAEHRVALDALEVGDVNALDQATRVELQSVDLVLQGTYHDIGAFHQSLASLPWLVIVDAFEVEEAVEKEIEVTVSGGELLDMHVRILLPLAVPGVS